MQVHVSAPSLFCPVVWRPNLPIRSQDRSCYSVSDKPCDVAVLGSPHLEQLEVKGCGDLRTVTLSNNCGSWRFLNWLNERWMGNPVESPKWILDCQGLVDWNLFDFYYYLNLSNCHALKSLGCIG